jgi:hypothetical protein
MSTARSAPCLRQHPAQPEDRVLEEIILCLASKDSVAMTHIHVEHTVPRVCPDNRNITASKCVLEPIGKLEDASVRSTLTSLFTRAVKAARYTIRLVVTETPRADLGLKNATDL